jgi:hypothetical protein
LCSPVCACPDATLVPTPFASTLQVIDPKQVPGALTGVALFAGPDGASDTLVVGYTPDLALGTDLDLAPAGTTGIPFAAIGWHINVSAQTSLTAYFASGKLRLTRACAAGVAGKLSNLTFTEQLATRDSNPYPGGCSFSVNEIDFDMGGSCP